jgi:hypothetical protein
MPASDLEASEERSEVEAPVSVGGKVWSLDGDANLSGTVDFGYRQSEASEERHAVVPIGPKHTFQLELPAGVLITRAQVTPEHPESSWRRCFLASEQKINDGPLTSERTYSLEVQVGFTVSGVVVDQNTGHPIAGAEVATGVEKPITTGASGEFTLPIESWAKASVPLRTRLVVTHADHLPSEIDVPEPESSVGVTGLTVALERGVTLRGRVLDSQGKGVASTITAMQDLNDRCPLGRRIAHCVSTRSLANGTFTLPPLPAVADIQVRASSSSHPSTCVRDLDLRTTPKELVIRLRPRVAFAVTATYPDGSHVAGDHGHLVFGDSNGELHEAELRSQNGWEFGGELKFSHPISVRAIGEGAARDRIYQGTGSALATDPLPKGQTKVEVAIVLSEVAGADAPPAPEGVRSIGMNSHGDWGFTWQLSLVDGDTLAPIQGRKCEFTLVGSGAGSTELTDGRVRLMIGGGLHQLLLRVPGYESFAVETEGLDHGYVETSLTLRRK